MILHLLTFARFIEKCCKPRAARASQHFAMELENVNE